MEIELSYYHQEHFNFDRRKRLQNFALPHVSRQRRFKLLFGGGTFSYTHHCTPTRPHGFDRPDTPNCGFGADSI